MGVGVRTAGVRPRVRDLGHSFAVDTLIRWPRSGSNLDERIGALYTYLGPVSPADTYCNLSATPELMAPRRRPAPPTARSRAVSPPAPALQTFTDRLIGRRAASPNTIGAYKVTCGCR